MLKKDLIQYIVHETGIVTEDVRNIIDIAFEKIREEVSQGNRVEITNFGIFTYKVRPPKRAYYLGGPRRKTKKPKMIMLPEKKLPHFKPTKKFSIAA